MRVAGSAPPARPAHGDRSHPAQHEPAHGRHASGSLESARFAGSAAYPCRVSDQTPRRATSTPTRGLVLALVALLLLAAAAAWLWWPDADADPADAGADAAWSTDFAMPTTTPDDPRLAIAVSRPREDSYYPESGDPGVDALHYDLDLTWNPDDQHLDAVETLLFRSTADSATFQLDLGEALEVEAVAVDGKAVEATHDGKDLVVDHPVSRGGRYTVQIAYSGTPEPTAAPTERSDFTTSGWTVSETDSVWTMQEPFGAFTWYAANDQPADKALYDFTLRVEAPWTGVANGTMTSRQEVDGLTVTSFRLAEPASSYLITVAFGDYVSRADETASGVPITYWTLRSQTAAFRELRFGRRAIEWAEEKLGPYPFSTAGILLTESDSGMETQTLVTLGDEPYVRTREVIVHEMVHQWYGDLVTPTDWRDVWMNEGMTMYFQLVYRAEAERRPIDAVMRDVEVYDQQLRDQAGPPGDYDPEAFGSSNIYYCPALMWHELRQELGDREFWRLVRAWPRQHAYGNANRDQWIDWIERETGRELSDFFDAWLLGTSTPPVD